MKIPITRTFIRTVGRRDLPQRRRPWLERRVHDDRGTDDRGRDRAAPIDADLGGDPESADVTAQRTPEVMSR